MADMTTHTQTGNSSQRRDTSEQAENPKPTFNQAYLNRVWSAAQIPDEFIDFDFSKNEDGQYKKLITGGHSKELWDIALQRAASWTNGESSEKGLLIAGSEGTGKSLAMWVNARAAVKSWLTANPPSDSVGTAKASIYCRRFKRWLRFEFCPSQDGKRNWNFDLIQDMLNSKAIFLDDLTLDINSQAFRPLCEFLEILIDDLTVTRNAPPLYITTNNTADDWRTLIGNQLVDRIVGPKEGICKGITCTWKSYR